MDGVISQAQETIKTLMFQRSTFGGINSKLSNISSRLPTVSKLCYKHPIFFNSISRAELKQESLNFHSK